MSQSESDDPVERIKFQLTIARCYTYYLVLSYLIAAVNELRYLDQTWIRSEVFAMSYRHFRNFFFLFMKVHMIESTLENTLESTMEAHNQPHF